MTMTAIAPSATGTNTDAALKEVRKAEAYANTGRLEEARRAIALDRRSQPAIALSRLLQDASHGAGPETETNCYTLLLDERHRSSRRLRRFFHRLSRCRRYADEALALCRAFEPEPLRSGLRISEIVETARHVMSKGVHQVGPYHHFGRDLHD
jgi:hypothetical protein